MFYLNFQRSLRRSLKNYLKLQLKSAISIYIKINIIFNNFNMLNNQFLKVHSTVLNIELKFEMRTRNLHVHFYLM